MSCTVKGPPLSPWYEYLRSKVKKQIIFAANFKLNSEWIKKSGEICGLANLGIRDDLKFWTDTDSFKVFVLVNYNESSEGSETYCKNVRCVISPI